MRSVQRAMARGIHDLVVYGFELPLGHECFFSLLRGCGRYDDEHETYYSSFELRAVLDDVLVRGDTNSMIVVVYYYPTRILVCCKPPKGHDSWSKNVVLWCDPLLVVNVREIVSAAYAVHVEGWR